MISQRIQALFAFIDYLDGRKSEYIDRYIPLCKEITDFGTRRAELKPESNYIDKLEYDELQKAISEKFKPITQNIYLPVLERLKALNIWSGDDTFASIWNNNSSAIHEFKENFDLVDIEDILTYKQKYLDFRKETNSNFLCLQFVFSNMDEILKQLFDFFKSSAENEFASFEIKTVEVNSVADAVKSIVNGEGKNVRFSIPHESLFDYHNINKNLPQLPNVKNEIIMGHKIQVGDISNNSGQIVIGKDIHISDSANAKNETAEKISELIKIIAQQQSVDANQKQSLITNFDKVREELFEEQPSKSKIVKWLSNTKGVLEKLVLSHEVVQAVDWVYKSLNFII